MLNTADLSRRKLLARTGLGLGAIFVSEPSRANGVRKAISSRKDG